MRDELSRSRGERLKHTRGCVEAASGWTDATWSWSGTSRPLQWSFWEVLPRGPAPRCPAMFAHARPHTVLPRTPHMRPAFKPPARRRRYIAVPLCALVPPSIALHPVFSGCRAVTRLVASLSTFRVAARSPLTIPSCTLFLFRARRPCCRRLPRCRTSRWHAVNTEPASPNLAVLSASPSTWVPR